jgi:hypothetical protein
MSFTQDELQAFNSILENRLAAHRREMERSLDRRMTALKRDFEHSVTTFQQDMLHRLPQRVVEQQKFVSQPPQDDSKQKFDAVSLVPQDDGKQEATSAAPQNDNTQPSDLERVIAQESNPAQQLESAVERGLAAQLLAIEQLLNQRIPAQTSEWSGSYLAGAVGEQGDLEGIEIQTDLPWEELVEVVDTAMDQRIALLKESIQVNIKDMANYVSIELNAIRGDLARLQMPSYNGDITNIREVFASIERLEHIIESMQVAMNANHALLSNRIFHHQQLPLERVHPSNNSTAPLAAHNEQKNGTTRPLPLLKGHEGDQQQS